MHNLTRIIVLLLSLTSVACLSASAQNTKLSNKLEQNTKVLLETSMGNITVALYNETPLHRDNFVKLVNEGYYDGVLFHRVIKDFMIQTGDPNSKTADSTAMLGEGDPGYTIPAEIKFPECYHKRGALAAARTSDQVNPGRRSSGSQFYIVTGRVYSHQDIGMTEMKLASAMKQNIFTRLVDLKKDLVQALIAKNDTAAVEDLQNDIVAQTEAEYSMKPARYTDEMKKIYTTVGGTPFLDARYTVFGEVLEGMDVVDRIQQVATGNADRPIEDVKIVKATIVK